MQKSSPEEFKKGLNNPQANELISKIIEQAGLVTSTSPSKDPEGKVVISYLENIMKNLQRCLSKPELKSELIKDEETLNFINSSADSHSVLVKLIQKKIAELKNNSNMSFSSSNSSTKISPFSSNSNSPTGMAENPTTNYFLFEVLADSDEILKSAGKPNYTFLIIISPANKQIDLITFGVELSLNYQLINGLLNNRNSALESVFKLKIEDFIEQREVKLGTNRDFQDILNLYRVIDEASVQRDSKISLSEAEIPIGDFRVNKMIIKEFFTENLKTIIVNNNYYQNFIHTNSSKLVRNLFENELGYFCSSKQIVQLQN